MPRKIKDHRNPQGGGKATPRPNYRMIVAIALGRQLDKADLREADACRRDDCPFSVAIDRLGGAA